jgi:limonene-1,2-epoxide hydrolase
MGAVEDFLKAMAAHDWDAMAATIADDGLYRDGPFIDVVEGKDAYVKFLSTVVPMMQNYELRIDRITAGGERRCFVELSEIFDTDEGRHEVPEVIIYETNEAGLINYVSVFIKHPEAAPPIEGGSAT